jgi:hypothetical protein
MRKRLGLRRIAGLTTIVTALVVVPVAIAGAISTTTNPAEDNPAGTLTLCNNGGASANDPSGTGAVNCNIYTDKSYVWVSGLPDSASLDPGAYFFAVLDPGGQRNPNDGSAGNLSDDTDLWGNRTFTIASDGTLTTGGTHKVAGNRIRVGLSPALVANGPDWFADTDNHGNVYILAVCEVPDPVSDSPGVEPQDCKYDAFKVSQTETTPPASNLGVRKDAATSLTRTHNWTIDKGVDACEITQAYPNGCAISGSSRTLNYTVTVTKDATAARDSAWAVSGHIFVNNPNTYHVMGVAVTDAINDTNNRATCVVSDGSYGTTTGVSHSNADIPAATEVDYPYSCSYTSAGPSEANQTNTATVTWDASNALPNTSNTGTAAVNWSAAVITQVHDSVSLSDLYTTVPNPLPAGFSAALSGSLPSGTINGSQTFNYAYLVTVPHDCVQLDNTATFTDSLYTGSDTVHAKVCRTPANTGALTMGFWQNKNGQTIIKSYCSGAAQVSPAVTVSLYTFLTGYNPFKDLTSNNCTNIATYVYNIIKAANASGAAMNAMLKAQMLATALDVYFSDPALGGNKIGASAPVGGINIDLTQICKMIDGSAGTATCSGIYQNASAAFGGAWSMTVSAMLAYAAGLSNSGGTSWYAQVKATQELAKNAFDAINNKVAFQTP